MEVKKSFLLDTDWLLLEMESDYPYARVTVVPDSGERVDGVVDPAGQCGVRLYVAGRDGELGMRILLYGPSGTGVMVPGGIQTVSHTVDLAALRKPKPARKPKTTSTKKAPAKTQAAS